jgi:hypothetical protein
MRELADSLAANAEGGATAASLLVEAADFERRIREDLLAAQRHLACALRLAPNDPCARAAYREVGWAIARPAAQEAPELAPVGAPVKGPEIVDEAEDAARVEDLTRKLHADPNDDRVVDELGRRLLRLGRSHELLALLSARIEDASPERRAALVPRQRQVLERLVLDAREAGRAEEASLFELALSALDGSL